MEELYTCDQIAKRYGVKVATVWKWIRNKKLNAVRIGRLYRIRAADVKNFERR